MTLDLVRPTGPIQVKRAVPGLEVFSELLLAQCERYAVSKSEMLPKSAAIKHPVSVDGVAHQPQIATVLRGEFVYLDKHPQPRRRQVLHTVQIDHHDLCGGQRLGQHGGQRWRGQRIQLTGHDDDTGLRPVLGNLDIQTVGRDDTVHHQTV